MRQQKFHSLIKEPQEVSASCLNHFSDLAVATNEKFKPRSWLKRTFLYLFYREALLNFHFSADFFFFLLTYASASTSVNLWWKRRSVQPAPTSTEFSFNQMTRLTWYNHPLLSGCGRLTAVSAPITVRASGSRFGSWMTDAMIPSSDSRVSGLRNQQDSFLLLVYFGCFFTVVDIILPELPTTRLHAHTHAHTVFRHIKLVVKATISPLPGMIYITMVTLACSPIRASSQWRAGATQVLYHIYGFCFPVATGNVVLCGGFLSSTKWASHQKPVFLS